MATIKSYSDLEQSKKLAEILPIESADMYYFLDPTPAGNIYHIVTPQIDFGVKTKEPEYNKGDIPCWSLAALLDVLPNDTSLLYFDNAYQMVYDKKPYVILNKFDNPIDSCVAMVIKLSELNLLRL